VAQWNHATVSMFGIHQRKRNAHAKYYSVTNYNPGKEATPMRTPSLQAHTARGRAATVTRI